MKLGNSKGNNRGKKYILRGRDDTNTPKDSHKDKAECFSQWFGKHYDSLLIELCQKDIYDEDVVNDTFLRIYDNILYGGIDIEHFRSYFMRAYFTNLIQGNIRDKRYSSISPYYDREDTSDYDPEIDLAQKQLEEDIFTYVYQRYQVHEFELFKMYVCLKPAVNYAALSELTKLKVHQIQFIVSKIKKDICRNREFTVRRRALVS